MIRITALRWVPPDAQGYVRDLRVRWACEEAGLPYEIRLIGREEQASESYRREQPFGQVPVLQDGDLTLFESGSILLYLGEKSTALLPDDPGPRARARTWVFAALNSIEPVTRNVVEVDVFYPQEAWAAARRPLVYASLKKRLGALSQWLGTREYLEEGFTVGDLMMSAVLRDLPESGGLAEFPALVAYRERCEARPAFKAALAGQLRDFAAYVAKQ